MGEVSFKLLHEGFLILNRVQLTQCHYISFFDQKTVTVLSVLLFSKVNFHK